MLSPALIYTFLRELLARKERPREPEPALVMDSEEEVKAYAHAGRIDGVMAASYLFHSARVTQTIYGSGRVLDLGCGPATQLTQIAQLNPETQFVGADLSDRMLLDATNYLQTTGVRNVSVVRDDIARLTSAEDASFDAVISTMALHHLPTIDLLDQCFAQVKRVLKPGGAIYLTDFCRLKRLSSIIYFAYINEAHQPHLFSLDYERSLRAAFSHRDYVELAQRHFGNAVSVKSTFGVPFLAIVKTPDRVLPAPVRTRLAAARAALQPRYRSDLNDMRTFFALGGLRDDPFA
jgi:arsenite methyltransferase